jgi:hypothetical protein
MSTMPGALREKFEFELFIEKTWNAIQFRVTELATDTWLEFVLDPVGQYAAIATIALILALCVGRFHTITEMWKKVLDKVLARSDGKHANGSGEDESGEGTAGPKDGYDKQEAASLASQLQHLHISTPKNAPFIAPRARAQRPSSVLFERDANNVALPKYRIPPQKFGITTMEGHVETTKKRKEHLDQLRMWS